jgi:hypothetical protein
MNNYEFHLRFIEKELNMTPEEEALERQKETEWFLTCCGSCKNFLSIMAEAGICKLNENGCICKNPKAFIDMFDDKCEKWEISKDA